MAANGSWQSVQPLHGYAPELNPLEQAWFWIKNGPLANCCAPTFADLTDATGRALTGCANNPNCSRPSSDIRD